MILSDNDSRNLLELTVKNETNTHVVENQERMKIYATTNHGPWIFEVIVSLNSSFRHSFY